ncbi:MAG TPA: AAA family ATPase [Pseudobdellovibrionaceae bacterium]|jgi:predicted AAA+ superfamily ATPase
MNVEGRNQLYLQGKFDSPGLFPSLETSLQQPVVFELDFGLKELPIEPGLIIVRGPRQFGKSTWLEKELKTSLIQFGAGSSFYLNGDFYRTHEDLYNAISDVHALFSKSVPVRRLFVDEITAIKDWEKAIKKLYDEGTTKRTLVITTGSQAVGLRRGSERLPGRKGKLDRTTYRFLPVSFSEFEKKCQSYFGGKTLMAYLMCGGSPIAANELVQTKRIPPYIIELTKDWILGECSRQGRDAGLLQFLLTMLHLKAMTPISMTKLAKESNAANNTIVQAYLELMRDLMSVSTCYQADPHTLRPIPRKAAKFHFINGLAALAFDPDQPWTLEEFCAQTPTKLGKWYEWAVASHIWKKSAYLGEMDPESQFFWSNDHHEIDFISPQQWYEVKSGGFSPTEFLWFPKSFPRRTLKVISSVPLEVSPSFMTTESLETLLRS